MVINIPQQQMSNDEASSAPGTLSPSQNSTPTTTLKQQDPSKKRPTSSSAQAVKTGAVGLKEKVSEDQTPKEEPPLNSSISNVSALKLKLKDDEEEME